MAAAASAAMLAAAHAFERLGGLSPCALCLQQRDFYWGALALSGAALLVRNRFPGAARLAAIGLALVFAAGAAVALYHVAVEQGWATAQCDAVDLGEIGLMGEGAFNAPKCDVVQWSLFGVSMAGYNALISAALALISVWVAMRSSK